MNKKLLFIFVFIYTTAAYGQDDAYQSPDYDRIEKNIQVKNTPYYYPDLLKKLKAYDTLMTEKQYTHLYYGYMFHEDYELFPEFSKEEELNRFMNGKFDKTEHHLFIGLLKEALEENPLDLRMMFPVTDVLVDLLFIP